MQLLVFYCTCSILFGLCSAYSNWPTQYHIIRCSITATLNGLRIPVDQPKKLLLTSDNMTECGRFISSEHTSFNFSGRLLIMRKQSDPKSYSELCVNESFVDFALFPNEPIIIVANSSTKNCDTNAKYRTARDLRERLRDLRGLFLVSTEVQRKTHVADATSSEASESVVNPEFPIFQSDYVAPGLLNQLLNAEENARTHLRNRSKTAGDEDDVALELTIRAVYGKSLSTNGYPTPLTISKTSVLFVAISFMTLMLVSLAWLLVYYVQRFRYVHAKDRIARRLDRAARKALARISTRTLRVGDAELASDDTVCAICIEPYAADQVVRVLPCRHTFHRSCVDAWLLEQRSCPVCKLDILKAFGLLQEQEEQDAAGQELVQVQAGRNTRRDAEARRSTQESSVHVVLTHADIAPRTDETELTGATARVVSAPAAACNQDEPDETCALMSPPRQELC